MYTLQTKNELPQVLSNMFNKTTEFHSYPTRIAKCYRPTKNKNVIFEQNFLFSLSPKYWNALPGTLKEKTLLSGVKNALKHFCCKRIRISSSPFFSPSGISRNWPFFKTSKLSLVYDLYPYNTN